MPGNVSGFQFTDMENPKKKRKTMNPTSKCILVMLCVILVGLVTLAIVYAVSEKDDVSFCSTKECVLAAGQVIQAIDPNVKPCHNFYQFACGGWLEKHTIPADSSGFDTFTKRRRDLQAQLRGLLEEPIAEDEIEAVKKTKRLYRSCLNEDKIEKVGPSPLRKLLEDLGGWPILDSTWKESEFNLVELLIKLRLFNNELLMSWGVTEDDKDPDKPIIYFDQEEVGMPSRDYYLVNRTDPTLQAYEDIAVNTAIMLGANEKIARKDMKDVIDFEIQLANITATKEERRDEEKLYHKMTMEHLQTNVITDMPFKWMDLVQGYFDHVNITINDTTEVIVYQISFLQKLTNLLKSTNNRIISNYLISRFVRHRIDNINAEFRHLGDQYEELVSGVKSTPARWKLCVSYVNGDTLMGDVTGRMFVKKYFDASARDKVKLLIKDLRASFHGTISEADWMDEKTRSYALEKLAAIEEKIGFDDALLNDTFVDESNKRWDFKEEDYFGNVLTVLRQYAIDNMQELKQAINKSQWTTTPGVINAFYSPYRNRITFPAGILQSPFYDKNYPSSINYGAIGAIIGHEFTHGFDDSGRAFDKDGKLRQWWSSSSLKEFKSRTKCMQDQYSDFVEYGDHVRGEVTLGENIADNGGLKIAFKAYERHISKTGEEKPLPGVDLTHRQLFFLSFAQASCGKSTREYEHLLITTDEHAPDKFRVDGTVSNNKEFAKHFNCEPGTPMNPEKKCSVW